MQNKKGTIAYKCNHILREILASYLSKGKILNFISVILMNSVNSNREGLNVLPEYDCLYKLGRKQNSFFPGNTFRKKPLTY